MKKFKNFLYYEWKKIIAVIAVIVIILLTVKQCNDKVATDLGVLCISGVNVGELTPLCEDLKNAAFVKDADGDGEATVKTRTILISADEAINIEQQVHQQIQLEIVSGENLVYLITEEALLMNAGDHNFADMTELAKEHMLPPQSCHAYEDGSIYAVSVEGNMYLEGMGINTKDMFIAMRNYMEKDKDSIYNINAAKAVEYILDK